MLKHMMASHFHVRTRCLLAPAVQAAARWSHRLLWVISLLLTLSATRQLAAQDMPIYTDSLQNGWADWSWSVNNNFNNTAVIHSGSKSISVTLTGTWGAFSLDHANLPSGNYSNLTFWINGGPSGGQQLQVYAEAPLGTAHTSVPLAALPTNSWRQITLSLLSLGITNQPDFARFSLQDRVGAVQPVFYLDDITLTTNPIPVVTGPAVASILVDAQANRRAISPLIYGTAFATSNQLSDLNFTMNRSGGNAETRYNWQTNAHNRAADWYFESIADSPAIPGASTDNHVANSKAAGAQAMITIPMIGWACQLGLGGGKLASYSIAKYGPQTGSDRQWMADAGNGVGTNAGTGVTWLITTNDPTDANFPVGVAFQQGYVQHLLQQWGPSTNGGVRYYIMDNEHTLWSSTHQDVHPVGPTMQEIWAKMLATASMVKSNDPNALVAGPEEWGWPGYFYSGYDQQWSGQHGDYNPAHYPDRGTNGGWDYMPWLLNQFHQHDTGTGRRLLDYFTLHCYPQESGVSGTDVSAATALLRSQSTRQFWDTNYVDPSWINAIIMLIPRMKNWVAAYYPGTKLGVTEYNWGAEADLNGATAQADLLGIFGREGLDLATRWTTPDPSTPTYLAMKMYRNYDGHKSTFGDTSVSASGPNPDNVSTFGAVRSADGALTVMVINKQLATSAVLSLSLTNFMPGGAAQAWQLTSNVIARLPDVPLTGTLLTNSLPPQSITLFVLGAGSAPGLRVAGVGAGLLSLRLDGSPGQRYILQSSPNLATWKPIQTNLLTTNFLVLPGLPATNAIGTFFRAVWAGF